MRHLNTLNSLFVYVCTYFSSFWYNIYIHKFIEVNLHVSMYNVHMYYILHEKKLSYFIMAIWCVDASRIQEGNTCIGNLIYYVAREMHMCMLQ